MGGYTDGEYNGGMAESSADYGGGITYEENQQYKVQGFPWSSSKGEGVVNLPRCARLKLNGLGKWTV